MLRLLVIGLWFMVYGLLLSGNVYACHLPDRSADNTPPSNNSGPCPGGLAEIEKVVSSTISATVGLAFVASLVWLILAGFKYLTSGGEPKALQSAHQTASWALLGILFLAIAWLILQLIQAFTGVPVTIFDIRTLCGNPSSKADVTKWFCGP